VLAGVAVVCFVAITLLRIPLLWVMLVMTPISVILTARYGERFAARPQVAAAKDGVKDTAKKEGAQ
jgi:chromate transporter